MKKFNVLLSFVPWITFWILYNNESCSIAICAFAAVIITVLLEYRKLLQLFILPCSTVVFFTLLGINAEFNLIIWFTYHTLLLIDFALAGIIWASLFIKKPFTMQYARKTVAKPYCNSSLFIRINWTLSLIWAIATTINVLPQIFIPHKIITESIFWSYGYSILCFSAAIYLNSKLPSILIGRNFWDTVIKLPPIQSPFLQDGYKPVKDELTLSNLPIIGNIPDDLRGTYIRNGPNPYFTPYTYTYPIDGDGLIHCITIKTGNVSYKNRFVKTKGLIAEIKAGKSLFAGIKLPIPPDPYFIKNSYTKNTASIHTTRLDNNRILALYEASPAYVLNNNLETIGEWKPNKIHNFLVNAHSRKDYKNNHIYMFTYTTDNAIPSIKLYEFDDKYNLVNNVTIPKSRQTMIHDFVITQNYVIFFDNPAIFGAPNNHGDESFLVFDDQQETDIYLVNRKTFETQTINNIDSFFIYHFVNAFETNDLIIVDFIYHERLELNPELDVKYPPLLYRGKINLSDMTYEHSPLSEQVVEFPNYNLKYTGQPYTYAYLLTKNSSSLTGFNAILKYNLKNLEQKIISFGENIELDEVTFVPKSKYAKISNINHTTDANANTIHKDEGSKTKCNNGAIETKQEVNTDKYSIYTEDDGYLIFFAYNKITDTSDFVVLEANMNNKILAAIKLPVRVPHGLHGSWSS
jgi:carotenoid cleavage dioxygenase